MKQIHSLVLLVLTITMLVSCDEFNQDASQKPPTITAQGFNIEETQQAYVGEAESIRIRVESAARIKTFFIKERSYEVDLATTPDRAHFELFGIDKKAVQREDITIDLKTYINQKLETAGEYEFSIEVTDNQQQKARVKVRVRLLEPEEVVSTIEQTTTFTAPVSLKTAHFEIQRVGSSEIQGSETFGLTWRTVDEILVTIRIKKKEAGATKLAMLSKNDYEEVATASALQQLLKAAKDQDYIDFDTANNSGSEQVLGVVNYGKPYVIKSSHTMSNLSSLGTTVRIRGEYKYY
ncbi:MAG: hypothetical protein AMJ53_16215 [Gammaproteobacteria bacterium SG8_11]|nr:MAG: hypothetical protein AMJ53_16215 [Gammaproteobacteria bacterium SG8_11]